MKRIKHLIAHQGKHLGMLGFGVLILAFVVRYVGIENIRPALQQMDRTYFTIAVLIEIFIVLLWNAKWGKIVGKVKKIKYWELLPIFMSGLAVNNLTPGPRVGGEPIRAYYLSKKTGLPMAKSLGTATLDVITHISVFGLLALFAILYIILFTELSAFRWVLAIVLALSVGVLLWMIYSIVTRGKPKKRKSWVKKRFYNMRITNFITNKFATFDEFEEYIKLQRSRFTETLAVYWRDKKTIWAAFIFSVIVHLLYILKQYMIFVGLGQQISFLHVFVGVTVAVIIGLFVWMPGGTGIVEAVSIAMFTSFGIEPGMAAAATLLSRALFYITTYGLGYASLSYLVMKYGKAVE